MCEVDVHNALKLIDFYLIIVTNKQILSLLIYKEKFAHRIGPASIIYKLKWEDIVKLEQAFVLDHKKHTTFDRNQLLINFLITIRI